AFAINAFRRATVLIMNNPPAGQQAAMGRALKPELEEDNITPVTSTHKNKSHISRPGLAET
ncbi:MAG TPA: hypothetical protein VFY40_14110, partial [Blastocatellia bacterium]|nr:hypothetical protein [Blastocatellia bacterium]